MLVKSHIKHKKIFSKNNFSYTKNINICKVSK